MNMKNKGGFLSTRTMVLVAVMTSLVVVLQLLGSFIRFGPFSISLVLVPIVIGAAVCGSAAGAWLGFAFGTFAHGTHPSDSSKTARQNAYYACQ